MNMLLEGEPRAPVKVTGGKRVVQVEDSKGTERRKGKERVAVEVELLLEEDELARCCYYCGMPENDGEKDHRFRRINGEGYESSYRCFRVRFSRVSVELGE